MRCQRPARSRGEADTRYLQLPFATTNVESALELPALLPFLSLLNALTHEYSAVNVCGSGAVGGTALMLEVSSCPSDTAALKAALT